MAFHFGGEFRSLGTESFGAGGGYELRGFLVLSLAFASIFLAMRLLVFGLLSRGCLDAGFKLRAAHLAGVDGIPGQHFLTDLLRRRQGDGIVVFPALSDSMGSGNVRRLSFVPPLVLFYLCY